MADEREQVVEILQALNRHINSFSEENRNTRKRAIDSLRKETLGRKPELETKVLQGVLEETLKPVLKLVSDPVEKCRELTITFLSDCVQRIPEPGLVLPQYIPVVVTRLAQQDITEPSEEIRLQHVELLFKLVELTHKQMAPYLDDMVQILQRTILDPYPEVRKHSCKCAALLAKTIPEQFHMQSESLVKPLLLSMSHQHSRVRVEVITALGDVLQYGNGKSVDDVVSHLAQRLFDQAPMVRSAVIQVVGGWLLDLMDRYSYFYKLIPLLLTGLTDDVPDIRDTADALWHDVGLKYEKENENDLKDKQDFMSVDPEHYPAGFERPNLGCRTLMYLNFSKILTGVVHDIADWVVGTRVKSAALLYTMLRFEEDNVTQHLEKVLLGLYKGCGDEEKEVVNYVQKSAELIGYFVTPEVWSKMVLDNVRLSQSPGALMVLARVIRGSQRDPLKPYLQEICRVLGEPGLCRVADNRLQAELLSCVDALLSVCREDCSTVSLEIFSILMSVDALHRSDAIRAECQRLLLSLSTANGYDGRQPLFDRHTRELIGSLQEDYSQWTQHSVERLVFDTLLMECGPVVGDLLEEIVPILSTNLHPDKDPEVRLKFFSLLSRLLVNSAQTLDSQHRFSGFAATVVKEMIVPNCVWRAGRVAAAIRTTAVSCLWALMQSGLLTGEQLSSVLDELFTQLRTTLEDDNKSTRLVTCRVLAKIFRSESAATLDPGQLHNLYPDLLKRLDDSSDDVRTATCATFNAYFGCLKGADGRGYEVGLYRAHLEAVYKGLLVHMDDPDSKIQEAVLDVLKEAAPISPDMLLKEVDSIKHKHRSTKYCDTLQEFIQKLPKPE